MHSFTNKGEEIALKGNGSSNGAIARLATAIRLYGNTSVPAKNGIEGVAFVQVANGNGYTTGGLAITEADWTGSVVSTNYGITLANKVWTASGSGIPNVAGAYIVDASNNVLGWWERTSATIPSGETLTASGFRMELRTGTP